MHFRETVALMGAHTLGHTNEQVRSNNKNKYSMREVNVNREILLVDLWLSALSMDHEIWKENSQ